MTRNSRRGFTFVELMIIVFIISVLTAIIIPRFTGARERAFEAAVLSDFRRAFTTVEDYFAATLRYPANSTDADFEPSKGVVVERWVISTFNGRPAMHIDLGHVGLDYQFHNLGFPYDGTIEKTSGESESLALLLTPLGVTRTELDFRAVSLGAASEHS